jgi:peroxidase
MIDGSCNNAARTAWGKSNSALQRLLPPRYGDGLGSPRVSSGGGPLPSARAVSTAVTSSQVRGEEK